MATKPTSRRAVLKGLGITAGLAVASPSISINAVSATHSGAVELAASSTIPTDAEIRVHIDEYDGEAGEILHTQTQVLDGGDELHILEGFEAGGANEYDVEVAMGANGNAPEIQRLTLNVPDVRAGDLDWKIDMGHDLVYHYERLRRYQPKLKMSEATKEHFQGMFGYIAEDDAQDTFVCCYWARFNDRSGLPLANAASDLGDHEPIYIFVDKETRDVTKAVYNGYHWFAAEITADDATMTPGHTSTPTHMSFDVVDEHHFFRHDEDGDGELTGLYSWIKARDTWDERGFYGPADPAAIEDPWQMDEGDDWWRDNSRHERMANVWRRIGIRGGDNTDPLRVGISRRFFLFDFWPFGGD